MKTLVTGGTGFLGAHLRKALEDRGDDVVAIGSRDCDLTRDDSLCQFDGESFDVIFHLAAWTQAGDFCLHHPGEQWVINQRINTNVLGWWAAKQPEAKLVAMGTSCAYAPGSALVEDHYLDGLPIESLYTYGMTKRMLYVGLQSLEKQFGSRWLCLVPSTLYGTGYHTDGRQMHFVFDLIRKIIRGHLYDAPVVLWGDGYQRRELVLVDDFVRAMLQLVDGVDNELVNIGAGEEFSIREFARTICEFVGYDFRRIEFDTSKYVGAKSKCLDTAKLKRLLPDFERTPLRDGLERTIAWFREHEDQLVEPYSRAG